MKCNINNCGGEVVDDEPHYIPLGKDLILKITDMRCKKCGAAYVGVMMEICKNCAGYQEEERAAGLLSACVTDELYADEDCQVIKDDVNDVVSAFMLGRYEQ